MIDTPYVISVAISQDGKFLISGLGDWTIQVWNFEEKRKEFTLRGHTNSVKSVAISPDGKHLISGSGDKTVKVWNLEEKKEKFTLYGHSGDV